MIHSATLRNGTKFDTGIRGEVGTKLARLALVQTGIIGPERLVLFALLGVTKGENGDRGHFAIATRHTEVPGNILAGALGALIDAPTSTLLRRRISIESAFTVDTFADHGNLVALLVEHHHSISPVINFALGEITCERCRINGETGRWKPRPNYSEYSGIGSDKVRSISWNLRGIQLREKISSLRALISTIDGDPP